MSVPPAVSGRVRGGSPTVREGVLNLEVRTMNDELKTSPLSSAFSLLSSADALPHGRASASNSLLQDRREHARGGVHGALVNLVAREYVQLATQALPFGARLVAEDARDRVSARAEPRARLKFTLAPTQGDVELVARGGRDGERSYHAVTARHVVRRLEFRRDLSTVVAAQAKLRDARDRRRAFRLDRPAEARRYPAEREQSLRRDLIVRAVGRVVLDCDLLDLFERRAVVAHVPEARDERAPRSQTAPVDVAQA